MYRAKESGRHNFLFYTREMNARAMYRLNLDSCAGIVRGMATRSQARALRPRSPRNAPPQTKIAATT